MNKLNDKDYWKNVHKKYITQDWIQKPSLFAQQVLPYFPKNAEILELGAGQGQDSSYFASEGFTVISTDFSEVALGFAKKNIPEKLMTKITFQFVDLRHPLPFKKFTFDIVYSHLALHYFSEERTKKLFDEIYGVLKPGGIFATITNPIDDPEIATLTKIANDYYETSEGFRKRFFSTKSLASYVAQFETILHDNKGETYKDTIHSLIRFVGRKR